MSSKKMIRKTDGFRKNLINKNREKLSVKDKEINCQLGFSNEDIQESIEIYKDLIRINRSENPENYDKETDYLLNYYCYGGQEGINAMIRNGDVITETVAEELLRECS